MRSRDVPIETDSAPVNEQLKEDIRWFDYIRRFETVKEKEKRIMLKDSDGGIHYLFPIEILAVQSWHVNPAHIQTIQRYSATLMPNMEVPIGISRYNKVKEILVKRKQ